MELSKDERQKILFCLRLGNPVPCDSLSVLHHLNDLDYINVSQRVAVDSEFSEVYIYNIYHAFTLLIGGHRLQFAKGDVLLRCIKNEHEILLVPMNKEFFEVGGSTAFDRYIFRDSVYVDKQAVSV